MSYVRRVIKVTFALGKGSFGEGGVEISNVVSLEGHRILTTIQKGNSPGFDAAVIRIFGMTRSLMNSLSRLGKPLTYERLNKVSISAGDDKGTALVFIGDIQNAWTDFEGIPDSSLFVMARSGQFDSMKAVPPTSFAGGADVAVIMSGFAAQMTTASGALGMKFENSGVTGKFLSNPYYPGTIIQQAEACARAADINMTIDRDTLAIWPKNGIRGAQIPLLSAATGLVGYPSYCDTGLAFKAEYNPTFVFGGQVKIESDLKPASGTWVINGLMHDLSAEQPRGPWFSIMKGYRFGDPATIVP